MKKAITIAILCIVFIIIYLLELNFFSWFTIAGIKPNLFIILTLFVGLYAGSKPGLGLGIFYGLLIDILGNSLIGISAVALGAIGFLRRNIRKKLFKKQ
ncbi:MAG: rod shape-determining protein MreD [Clostridia bacterium]|jgi:rod shape-determining protein MreD|nr:rod shape-determining protein MreD [Clostridia bacterium]